MNVSWSITTFLLSHTSHHNACRPCTGAHRRDFLLGIRCGQPAGAHVRFRCSRHRRSLAAPSELARPVDLSCVRQAACERYREISKLSVGVIARTASGRPEAIADDERPGEVGPAHSSWEAGERSGTNREGVKWSEGAGPERMWTCKTRSGHRAGKPCHVRRPAYEKQIPAEICQSDSNMIDKRSCKDEGRIGQQGTLTRIWAKRSTRPRIRCDRRFTWAYLFGAICPGTRHRRRPGHAGCQYRRHEPTSGRNHQMR